MRARPSKSRPNMSADTPSLFGFKWKTATFCHHQNDLKKYVSSITFFDLRQPGDLGVHTFSATSTGSRGLGVSGRGPTPDKVSGLLRSANVKALALNPSFVFFSLGLGVRRRFGTRGRLLLRGAPSGGAAQSRQPQGSDRTGGGQARGTESRPPRFGRPAGLAQGVGAG